MMPGTIITHVEVDSSVIGQDLWTSGSTEPPVFLTPIFIIIYIDLLWRRRKVQGKIKVMTKVNIHLPSTVAIGKSKGLLMKVLIPKFMAKFEEDLT
jgi:hypothetical protein